MKTIWPPGRLPFGLTFRMPWMFMRVVCGFSVTMAIFSPTSALSSVLLPALGRPIIDTKPECFCAIMLCLSCFCLPGRRISIFRLRPANPDLFYFAICGFKNFKTEAFVFNNLAGLRDAASYRADQAPDGSGVALVKAHVKKVLQAAHVHGTLHDISMVAFTNDVMRKLMFVAN